MSCPHLLYLIKGNSLWGLVWFFWFWFGFFWFVLFFYRTKIVLYFYCFPNHWSCSALYLTISSPGILHISRYSGQHDLCWIGEMASQLAWFLLDLGCLHLFCYSCNYYFSNCFLQATECIWEWWLAISWVPLNPQLMKTLALLPVVGFGASWRLICF